MNKCNEFAIQKISQIQKNRYFCDLIYGVWRSLEPVEIFDFIDGSWIPA